MQASTFKQILSLCLLAAVFLIVSYFAQRYHVELAAIVESGGMFGVIGFITLTAIFVVFVIPLDIVFLIPIGTAVFGPIATALMSIAGWVIGAAVAFGIARQFGRPVVERLIGLDRVHAVESRIPKRNLFWSVVVLRMLISVDILSYALGLASDMRWGRYIFATALGVMPFGFYFAYTGSLPLVYRILSILGALMLASVIVLRYRVPREP